eukprot:360819-Chlamydomonas_euryale.AAC.9
MARDGAKEATWPGLRIGRALAPAAVWQYLGYGGAAAAMICLEWWAHRQRCGVRGGGGREAREAIVVWAPSKVWGCVRMHGVGRGGCGEGGRLLMEPGPV